MEGFFFFHLPTQSLPLTLSSLQVSILMANKFLPPVLTSVPGFLTLPCCLNVLHFESQDTLFYVFTCLRLTGTKLSKLYLLIHKTSNLALSQFHLQGSGCGCPSSATDVQLYPCPGTAHPRGDQPCPPNQGSCSLTGEDCSRRSRGELQACPSRLRTPWVSVEQKL